MSHYKSKNNVALFICIGLATVSCTTVKPYTYYLDKDVSHKDVYKINASIHSDGTCNFSIGENEIYDKLSWFNPANIENNNQLPTFSGICRYKPKNNAEYKYSGGVADMYISVYNSEAETYLDVNPAATHVPGDNPPGVYFSIRNPQTVREPRGVFCGLGLYSLKGKAYAQSKPDDLITLRISALAYATDVGCS